MNLIGADIARFGDDLTVFTKRVGYRLTEIREYRKQWQSNSVFGRNK